MFDICTNVPPLACENWVRDAVMPWLLPFLAGAAILAVGAVAWIVQKCCFKVTGFRRWTR